MIPSERDIWEGLEYYYHDGCSVIWCRAESEVINGKTYPPKTPIYGWKSAQVKPFELKALAKQLSNSNIALSPALICGKVSGNLEIIDIDTKQWKGIDARYFSEIKTLYPSLFSKLRIHKTPSGGFHIVYKCDEPILEGNKKLAYAPDSKEAGLETRGEGGYALCPPGLGYSIFQDRPIPIITLTERNALVQIAKLFNTKVKVVNYKPTVKLHSIYHKNPFEHYNASSAAENLLLDFGWKLDSYTSQYVYFTREGKTSGISASFIKDRRLYHIFTSSSDLYPDTTYTPSDVLATLAHNGDYKLTYKYLTDKGFGVLKPDIEDNIIKKSLINKTELPKNLSQKAIDHHTQLEDSQKQKYPHGIFWRYKHKDDGYIIIREELYRVAHGLGFMQHKNTPIQVRGMFIYNIEEKDFFNSLKKYIQEEDDDEYILIASAYEWFIQKSGAFSLSRTCNLDESLILQSTINHTIIPFSNCIIKITKDGIFSESYTKYEGRLIFHKSLIPRKYTKQVDYHNSVFYQYIGLATRFQENEEYIKKLLGFLCCGFKTTTGHIIAFIEEVSNPRDGGGAGKNVLMTCLSHFISAFELPGDMISYDESFMQAWQGQKLMYISDPPSSFKWTFLKNLSTNGGMVKKLFKNKVEIGREDMPNFIVLTNYSYNTDDGGVLGRIRPLEFTNFFY